MTEKSNKKIGKSLSKIKSNYKINVCLSRVLSMFMQVEYLLQLTIVPIVPDHNV